MIRSIYHIGTVPCHKSIHRYCTRSTCTHVCSLKSLARKRTAFYAWSTQQDKPYVKITVLSR